MSSGAAKEWSIPPARKEQTMSAKLATDKQREWADRVVRGLCDQDCPHVREPRRNNMQCHWCLKNALTKAKYGTVVR